MRIENNIQKSYIALRFDKNFELYIKDIERATKKKIPEHQKEIIKQRMKEKDYYRLPLEERRRHRSKFNGKKNKIVADWEEHTNQKWTRYTEPVYSKKGKVIRIPGQRYDIHHIIECSWGGDNEWYNMHPAKHPSEHQQDIHRKGGYADMIFNNKEKIIKQNLRENIRDSRAKRRRVA